MSLTMLAGCATNCITVQAADQPQGPWSASTRVWRTTDNPNGYQMYAPAVQPKYDATGSTLVLTYTGFGRNFGNIIQAVKMSFV